MQPEIMSMHTISAGGDVELWFALEVDPHTMNSFSLDGRVSPLLQTADTGR